MNGKCTFCDGPVSADRDYRKVVGWERNRAAGGTNAIAAREPQDEWACTTCIEKLKRGVTIEQQSLL